MNRNDGWLVACVLGFALFIMLLMGDDRPPGPVFTCGEHEVGVWDNYEASDMDCVADTDHEAHGGHDG